MTSYAITNFTAGELSRRMAGRIDFAKYFSGCWQLENMLVQPQGGSARRPGTVFVASAKNSAKKARLVPFEFSDEQAYLLEFGHEYIRFYKDQGQLVGVDSSTKLLLHMDGLDGSTSFEDEGDTVHTITSNNGAKVNTAHAKFGTGSLFLDRTVDSYLSIGDHADWDMDTGAFTFDFWFEPRSLVIGSDHCFFSQFDDADNYVYFGIYRQSVSMYWLKAYVYNATAVQLSISSFQAGWSPAGKQHYAFIRGWGSDADAVVVTVNGAFAAGALMIGTKHWPNLTADFEIGRGTLSGSVKDMDGYIDEFRVSKGVARWTSAFSPPTVEYPQAMGGTAYEIATPYTEADLPHLKFTQSADTVYIAHPDYAPRKLTRTGHTSWILAVIDFQPPPTYEADFAPDATLTASATSGTGVTFTAGSAVFLAADAGRQLMYPGEGARAIITTFSTGTAVLADVIDAFPDTGSITSGDWSLRNSPATGVTPSGIRKHSIITLTADDDCWRSTDVGKYVLINSGAVRITAYTSATVVKGEVLSVLSNTDKDSAWTLESAQWNGTLGYPGAVGFHEERLCFAGSDFWQQTVWGSVSGDYENHTGGANDADALTLPLSSGEMNRIRWLLSHSALLAGSGGSEWRIGSSGYLEPLSPSNVQAKEESFHGVANIAPIKANNAILFVQRAGRKLRELAYSKEREGFVTTDLTILADHLTEEHKIIQLAWQKEPVPTLWAVRSDGILLSMVYERAHEVIAWSRHVTDGYFESVAVIPSTTGPDEVWVAVKRTIGGSEKRYVEYLAPDFKTSSEDAWHVDSGLKYDGAEVSAVSGLDHLEGETVSVLVDGAEHADCTVASGSIDLDPAGSVIIAGLPFTSVLETVDLELADEGGTSQGRPKTISQLAIRFFRTIAAKAGSNEDDLVDIPFRTPGDDMDEAIPLFTGDKKVSFPGGWNTSQSILIQSDGPMPMTVLGIFAETDVGAD